MVGIRRGYDGVIQISAFELDRTEVTVRAYMACVRAGVCIDPRDPPKPGRWPLRPANRSCNADDPAREHHPINCVSAIDAETYCAWVGKRLPTDVEWKWAAQGRDHHRRYPWGSQRPSCERAVVSDYRRYPRSQRGDVIDTDFIRAGCSTNRTWPVGSKPLGASRDGALDMSGNVEEWTRSCVMDSGFALMGGDYGEPHRSFMLTVSERSTAAASLSGPHIGFRCARSNASSHDPADGLGDW
jgi:formylglycine-generating enzyme required for sulfatase activity